jgi:hypothetical protein
MKRILTLFATFFLLLLVLSTKAQELEILTVNHLPDTTSFGRTVNTQITFKFQPAALVAPFTVHFQYMINGVPQEGAIDSFIYLSADTHTQTLMTALPINNIHYRKGDNIIVIWPVCSQREHTLNFFRSGLFVEDSLTSSLGNSHSDEKLLLQYDHERKLLLLESAIPNDALILLDIYDLQGRLRVSEDCSNNRQIPISEMAAGLYIAHIHYREKQWVYRVTIY